MPIPPQRPTVSNPGATTPAVSLKTKTLTGHRSSVCCAVAHIDNFYSKSERASGRSLGKCGEARGFYSQCRVRFGAGIDVLLAAGGLWRTVSQPHEAG